MIPSVGGAHRVLACKSCFSHSKLTYSKMSKSSREEDGNWCSRACSKSSPLATQTTDLCGCLCLRLFTFSSSPWSFWMATRRLRGGQVLWGDMVPSLWCQPFSAFPAARGMNSFMSWAQHLQLFSIMPCWCCIHVHKSFIIIYSLFFEVFGILLEDVYMRFCLLCFETSGVYYSILQRVYKVFITTMCCFEEKNMSSFVSPLMHVHR